MLKILIAEDEEPIANLIKMNLRRAGYQCTWASDGEKAADLMDTEKFDLLLLDVMLPGINGYELMEYARSLELPVIFLTALGSTENKVKGLKMGADDYLTKPFEIVELLARVEAVLRRYHKAETILNIFDVVIDTASRSVMQNGEPVSLTMKEFGRLYCPLPGNHLRDGLGRGIYGPEPDGGSSYPASEEEIELGQRDHRRVQGGIPPGG